MDVRTERTKNAELREQLGLEPVSFVIKKYRLRWFGHVEHKDDTDLIKWCTTMEVEVTKPSKHPRKTWWDDIKDMKQFGLCREDTQPRKN